MPDNLYDRAIAAQKIVTAMEEEKKELLERLKEKRREAETLRKELLASLGLSIAMSGFYCPFCGEEDFDLIGLKHHLLAWCEKFSEIEKPDAFYAAVEIEALRKETP